jgi:Putative methyltransferase
VAQQDWVRWHEPYEDPDSYLSQRLAIVQGAIRDALEAAPAGPIRVVSLCAGQGRDLLGVLEDHPRREEVSARLVELDARNVAAARDRIAQLGLAGSVDVVEGDAAETSAYAGAVPARVVLACGVFGNIPDAEIEQTIHSLPMFCQPGATVVWTRHRLEPDLTPTVRQWFVDAGFAETAFHGREGFLFGVGVDRLEREPPPFDPDRHLFTFFR